MFFFRFCCSHDFCSVHDSRALADCCRLLGAACPVRTDGIRWDIVYLLFVLTWTGGGWCVCVRMVDRQRAWNIAIPSSTTMKLMRSKFLLSVKNWYRCLFGMRYPVGSFTESIDVTLCVSLFLALSRPCFLCSAPLSAFHFCAFSFLLVHCLFDRVHLRKKAPERERERPLENYCYSETKSSAHVIRIIEIV